VAKYRSEIFKLSEEYFQKSLEHDVIASTYAKNHSQDDGWNDYSYHPVDSFSRTAKSYLKKIKNIEPIDYYDELAQEAIILGIEEYLEDSQDPWLYTFWGSVFSEPENIYSVFEVMPKESRKDILNIINRLEAIPTALNQWVSSLKDVAELGHVNAKIRVGYTADVVENIANGKFVKFAEQIDENDKRLIKAAKEAEISFEQLAAWLRGTYMNIASDNFGVGEKRYINLVKSQSGKTINPREVYESGLKELDEINAQMWEIGKKINPKAKTLKDFANTLNNDPAYIIEGADNFKKFLEELIKMAILEMNGTYFVIPPALKKCLVEMDEDTIDESPYYQGPSDDMTRPGKTSYPTLGRTKFTTWENYSTWFHESIPGHHMQIGTSTLNKDTLSVYQREEGWNSGYGEGWALYSERLMDELGYFSDPGYKMGYLLCQAMRAARLVVDIGLHLQYKDPDGKIWTPEAAVKLMEERAMLDHRYAVSEVKRYISWAGQAITYKLGERVWLKAREDAKLRLGDKFDLKKFHMYALKLGPMGLDRLEEELSKWNGK
jgi:uncharacterized protein (DUF885 family)